MKRQKRHLGADLLWEDPETGWGLYEIDGFQMRVWYGGVLGDGTYNLALLNFQKVNYCYKCKSYMCPAEIKNEE